MTKEDIINRQKQLEEGMNGLRNGIQERRSRIREIQILADEYINARKAEIEQFNIQIAKMIKDLDATSGAYSENQAHLKSFEQAEAAKFKK